MTARNELPDFGWTARSVIAISAGAVPSIAAILPLMPATSAVPVRRRIRFGAKVEREDGGGLTIGGKQHAVRRRTQADR